MNIVYEYPNKRDILNTIFKVKTDIKIIIVFRIHIFMGFSLHHHLKFNAKMYI